MPNSWYKRKIRFIHKQYPLTYQILSTYNAQTPKSLYYIKRVFYVVLQR